VRYIVLFGLFLEACYIRVLVLAFHNVKAKLNMLVLVFTDLETIETFAYLTVISCMSGMLNLEPAANYQEFDRPGDSAPLSSVHVVETAAPSAPESHTHTASSTYTIDDEEGVGHAHDQPSSILLFFVFFSFF
jgi:hypothetical protein